MISDKMPPQSKNHSLQDSFQVDSHAHYNSKTQSDFQLDTYSDTQWSILEDSALATFQYWK